MKVYIVTSGEYSDYHIDEVFSIKKQAEIYCTCHDLDYANVEEYEILENPYAEDVTVRYAFRYTSYNEWGELSAFDPRVRYVLSSEKPKHNKYGITVILDENNPDKAFKIACDEWAKIKAQRAGL